MAKKKGIQKSKGEGAGLHAVLVLDASASMSHLEGETIKSVNEYLTGIIGDVEKITIAVFNTGMEGNEIKTKTYDDLSDGVELLPADYVCGGATPLLDAVGTAVSGVTDKNALVVVVTDGHENSSREYSGKQIKALIEEKTEAGWKFIYLGANQDAWAAGAGLGFQRDSSYNFAATKGGIRGMSVGLTGDTVAYAASFTSNDGANWKGENLAMNDAKAKGVDDIIIKEDDVNET